jgi:hypothetical protein
MKRYLNVTIAIMLAVNIACGVFAISAEAQTNVSPTMRAEVPFTFRVGDKTLPAGVYTVSILNPTSDRKTLQIRSKNGRVSAIVQTVSANAALAKHAKLVFHRYGDQYFFAQAQLLGESTSLAATKTRAERATQRAVRHGGDGTVITVLGK